MKMNKQEMKTRLSRLKRGCKKGFTLVELLVVIAIIAVIGSGIAVTYSNLDDHAKTSMEMSDISALKKVIKHWSAVRGFDEIPNKFDLLVDTDGNLINYWFAGHPPLEVGTATPEILSKLSSAGLNVGYVHDSTASIANDSTFEGSYVDTDNTIRTLAAGASQAKLDAQAFEDDQPARDAIRADWTAGTVPVPEYAFSSTSINYSGITDDGTLTDAEDEVDDILNSAEADQLAFIAKESDYTAYGLGIVPSSVGLEIISNLGLDPEKVASASEDQVTAVANGRECYLVAMGVGRFATLYKGRTVRADGPPKGKRYSGNDTYSRYMVVVKVPVAASSHVGGASAEIVQVLSPQGYTVAALEDYLEGEREELEADF